MNNHDEMLPFYEAETTAIHTHDADGARAACAGRSAAMGRTMIAELVRRGVFSPSSLARQPSVAFSIEPKPTPAPSRRLRWRSNDPLYGPAGVMHLFWRWSRCSCSPSRWPRLQSPTSTSARRRASTAPAPCRRTSRRPPRDRPRTSTPTPTAAPLNTVRVDTLGLDSPGVLTVGTLSDAPPSICIDSTGEFTGFDNELLRAIAEKLGLRVNFVGTEFSGLLAQVASRRFDVGSSSITTTDCAPAHRRVHQRLRLRLLLAGRPAGVGDHRIRQAGRRPAHRRRAGHRAGGLRRRHRCTCTR